MKKKLILSALAMLSFTTFSEVSATTKENTWQKVDAGTKIITKNNQKELEEELASRVELLRQTSTKLGKNEEYRYQITFNEDKNLSDVLEISHQKSFSTKEEAIQWSLENELTHDGYQFIQNTVKPFQIEKIFAKTKYNSEDEATNALNLLAKNLSHSDLKITKERNQEKDTLLQTTEVYATKEEADKALEKVTKDTEEYQVTAKVEVTKEKNGIDQSEIKKSFSTKKEAQDYIQSLKDKGYQVEASIEEVKTKKQENYQGPKRDTKDEAQNDLDNFFQEYPNQTEGKIEKVRDNTKDKKESTSGEEEFTSLESATERKNALEVDNEDYKVEATIRQGKKNTSIEEAIESKVFDSKLEAENYLKELQEKGYDTSKLEVKLLSYEESIWKTGSEVVVDPGSGDDTTFHYGHFDVTLLNTFTKIDEKGNESTVTGSIKVDSVKINDKKINMSGPSKDPNTGKYEYTSVSRNSLDVTNKSLVEITGSITFNGTTLPFTVKGYLSENQNVCGGRGNAKGYDLEFRSIKIVENKVYIDSNITSKYQVVGTAIKNLEEDVWYVDTTKTIKGYVYQAIASGEKEEVTGYQVKGIKSIQLWKDLYLLQIQKLVKGYDYYISGKGIETAYDVTSTYHKLIEANWVIEKISLHTGDIEVLPPKTGVDSAKQPILFMMIIIAIIYSVCQKICQI